MRKRDAAVMLEKYQNKKAKKNRVVPFIETYKKRSPFHMPSLDPYLPSLFC